MNSGSQTACRTRLSRSWTRQSSKQGTPSGRKRPAPLGMQAHRIVCRGYSIHSVRLAPVLALEARVEPFRVEHQTHQGGEPLARLLTRLLCETSQSCCHGQSPLCVGPCRPNSLSQTATPLLPAHYRRSALLWVAPTSDNLRPLPRFLRLSEGAPILRHRLSDLPGYRAISM